MTVIDQVIRAFFSRETVSIIGFDVAHFVIALRLEFNHVQLTSASLEQWYGVRINCRSQKEFVNMEDERNAQPTASVYGWQA